MRNLTGQIDANDIALFKIVSTKAILRVLIPGEENPSQLILSEAELISLFGINNCERNIGQLEVTRAITYLVTEKPSHLKPPDNQLLPYVEKLAASYAPKHYEAYQNGDYDYFNNSEPLLYTAVMTLNLYDNSIVGDVVCKIYFSLRSGLILGIKTLATTNPLADNVLANYKEANWKRHDKHVKRQFLNWLVSLTEVGK